MRTVKSQTNGRFGFQKDVRDRAVLKGIEQ